MNEPPLQLQRRTSADVVFELLLEEIVCMRLRPGDKLSEAEIARRFGVSRQPVRDAFNKLENLDLLLVRPQRATLVRGFSMKRITQARFVRLAVEIEVVQRACSVWDNRRAEALERNLAEQRLAIETGRPEHFRSLDYQYHKLICDLGGASFAFDIIEDCKKRVDRLCTLSFDRENEFSTLLQDHRQLASALREKDADRAASTIRMHLERLDDTIREIHVKHAGYFE